MNDADRATVLHVTAAQRRPLAREAVASALNVHREGLRYARDGLRQLEHDMDAVRRTIEMRELAIDELGKP